MKKSITEKRSALGKRSACGVDTFIGNSHFIAKRIEKCYRRKAEVVYPPVSIEDFPLQEKKDPYYVTASRLVNYKRVDLIVEAFRLMPNRQLVVVGDGPEGKKIKRHAPKNVVFMGYVSKQRVAEIVGKARAFIYAALEDFGIAPLEAQSCGTPVIAYGHGGVKETCEETGYFFMEHSPKAIQEAVEHFEKNDKPLSFLKNRKNAERFSIARFRQEFLNVIGTGL